MFDQYYEEMQVGDRREFSGMTITEAHVVNFAGVTGDHFGLHLDAEYARTTPFKQRVAHGLLVLSCGAGLVPILPGRMTAFLGMEEVRFTAPVFFGDTIHPRMEVLEKSDRAPGRGGEDRRGDPQPGRRGRGQRPDQDLGGGRAGGRRCDGLKLWAIRLTDYVKTTS